MPPILVRTDDDVLALLDELVSPADSSKWTRFYGDRERSCPFFVNKPDYTLVEYVQTCVSVEGSALDVGCGAGRNSIFLAKAGFKVVAIDISSSGLDWARERTAAAGVDVLYHELSFLRDPVDLGSQQFRLIHDSGCFHHLPPHRRATYRRAVMDHLMPGGFFSLTCFSPTGGSGLSDIEVYRSQSLKGGLGYTIEELVSIFQPDLHPVETRNMVDQPEDSPYFGRNFLLSVLFRRGGTR